MIWHLYSNITYNVNPLLKDIHFFYNLVVQFWPKVELCENHQHSESEVDRFRIVEMRRSRIYQKKRCHKVVCTPQGGTVGYYTSCMYPSRGYSWVLYKLTPEQRAFPHSQFPFKINLLNQLSNNLEKNLIQFLKLFKNTRIPQLTLHQIRDTLFQYFQ